VFLADFLAGLLAILALKGHTRFSARTGVLDAALRETLAQLRPAAEKTRVRARFRLASDALARPNSNLSKALARLEADGLVRRSTEEFVVSLSGPQAYVELEALPVPLEFVERAAKVFLKRHAIARIRHGRAARVT
jgi:hypothetical protein